MTTVGEAHAENGIAGAKQREIHSGIRLRTGVRLDVGVDGAKQLFGAINGQTLGHINILATAVIALARITFGIFVGQNRSLRSQYTRRGVVFRGNQLDMIFLAADFILHGLPEHLIKTGNGHILAKHPDFSPPVSLNVTSYGRRG